MSGQSQNEYRYDRLTLRWKSQQDLFTAALQKYGALLFTADPDQREAARLDVLMTLESQLDIQAEVAHVALEMSGVDPEFRHLL